MKGKRTVFFLCGFIGEEMYHDLGKIETQERSQEQSCLVNMTGVG